MSTHNDSWQPFIKWIKYETPFEVSEKTQILMVMIHHCVCCCILSEQKRGRKERRITSFFDAFSVTELLSSFDSFMYTEWVIPRKREREKETSMSHFLRKTTIGADSSSPEITSKLKSLPTRLWLSLIFHPHQKVEIFSREASLIGKMVPSLESIFLSTLCFRETILID